MSFFDVERDDREEWLHHPVTTAFVELIMHERAAAVVDLVDQIKSAAGTDPMRLQHVGGRLAAVDELLHILGYRKAS